MFPSAGDAQVPVSASVVAGQAGRPLLSETFTAETLRALRHAVAQQCRRAGLMGQVMEGFVLAVHELATNAVRHGGGTGHLELRVDGDTLTCQVRDDGPGADPDALRPMRSAPEVPYGRGLWLAQELTDGLVLGNGPAGVTATVTVCVESAPTTIVPPAGSAMTTLRTDGAGNPTEGGLAQ